MWIPGLCLLFSSVFMTCLHAQQISKSGGTSNSTFLLGSTAYARKSQLLYPAASLTNEHNGKINRIYFKYGSTGTNNQQTVSNLKIKFGHTSDVSFSGNSFYTDLVTVLDSASLTIPAKDTEAWFSIPVDTLFEYDVARTLILQISFQTSTVANWGTLGTTNTPVRKIISSDTGAVSGDGTSSTWQDFGFDVLDQVLATAPQISSQTGINLFPNPASDKISFNLTDQNLSRKQYMVYNLQGQTVLNGTVEEFTTELDLRSLPTATYFLEVMEESRTHRRYFVKR